MEGWGAAGLPSSPTQLADPAFQNGRRFVAGLFDWSMAYQDGTHPSSTVLRENFTTERKAW
jgi:hypothetical protein